MKEFFFGAIEFQIKICVARKIVKEEFLLHMPIEKIPKTSTIQVQKIKM